MNATSCFRAYDRSLPCVLFFLFVAVVGGSPKLVCVGAGVLSFSSENPLIVCIGCVGVVVSPLLHSLVHLHSLTLRQNQVRTTTRTIPPPYQLCSELTFREISLSTSTRSCLSSHGTAYRRAFRTIFSTAGRVSSRKE